MKKFITILLSLVILFTMAISIVGCGNGNGNGDGNRTGEQPTVETPAERATEPVRVLLVNRGLTNAQLADMVASGDIPANVTEMSIIDNMNISDLSPLASLTNLEKLTIVNELVSDLSSLSGLMNLVSLNVSRNQVSDLSPLAGLINLTDLRLSGNQITDLSPLANLTNLEHLSLERNPITDWSPVDHVYYVWGDPRVGTQGRRRIPTTASGEAREVTEAPDPAPAP